jgi:hypothetical protein
VGESDLAVDMEFLQHPCNGQRCADRENLRPAQRTAGKGALHGGFDFALSADAEALEELSELEVEDFGVHGTSMTV